MSLDMRLIIPNMPHSKVELCPFLKEMNKTEETIQKREQEVYSKQMFAYSWGSPTGFETAGIFLGLGSYFAFTIGLLEQTKETRVVFLSHSMGDRRFAIAAVALVILAMVSFSIHRALQGRTAPEVDIPKSIAEIKTPEYLNWKRLSRKIDEIKERIKDGSETADQKEQLRFAQTFLKAKLGTFLDPKPRKSFFSLFFGF